MKIEIAYILRWCATGGWGDSKVLLTERLGARGYGTSAGSMVPRLSRGYDEVEDEAGKRDRQKKEDMIDDEEDEVRERRDGEVAMLMPIGLTTMTTTLMSKIALHSDDDNR